MENSLAHQSLARDFIISFAATKTDNLNLERRETIFYLKYRTIKLIN